MDPADWPTVITTVTLAAVTIAVAAAIGDLTSRRGRHHPSVARHTAALWWCATGGVAAGVILLVDGLSFRGWWDAHPATPTVLVVALAAAGCTVGTAIDRAHQTVAASRRPGELASPRR